MIDKKEIILKAIKQYGEQMQLTVAMEELAELIKELSKYIRGERNIDNIIEEMADVRIMLAELQLILNISNEDIENEILFKLDRLNNRVEGKEMN